ncbi:hypothetical protein BDL97_03G127800 [Sphagnum fallax]|nr:hypothetical protein BDL97_03G127800 [Sphagnum fallax]
MRGGSNCNWWRCRCRLLIGPVVDRIDWPEDLISCNIGRMHIPHTCQDLD